MFIAIYNNGYRKYIGEGENIIEAINDLEDQMRVDNLDPKSPNDYEFYSAKTVKVKLEYTIVE